jgi:hypothetical protein
MSEVGDKIAVQINLTRSFQEGQGISWTTTVPQDIKLGELDDMLDRFREASVRQARWHRLERMEGDLEHENKRLAQLTSNVNMIDEKHPNQDRAPADVRSTRQQTVDSIIRTKDLIAMIEADILRVRGQLLSNGG